MKKICLIVQDGASIKNYLYSDIIKYLNESNYKIYLLHSISKEAIDEVEKVHSISLNSYKIETFRDNFISVFLKELFIYSRLILNKRLTKNNTIMENWNPRNKGLLKFTFYKIIEALGYLVSFNYSLLLKIENIYSLIIGISNNNYEKILKEISPDIVFNTNQRLVNSAAIIEIAKKMKIKTVGCIFSWDNLPKGTLLVKSNLYFVWSSYMKDELTQYYPEINPKHIIVTGTPQFEFYSKKEFHQSKSSFFKMYNLDINKKVICFSGDDKKTSPYDANYLEDIASELSKIKEEDRPQIFFRPCPVDLSNRYDKVIEKYPDIIKRVKPIWGTSKNQVNWSFVFPHFEDIKLLVNIALHCDIVVNIGSTMAHDFFITKKPAAYINYDVKKTSNWTTKIIYNFQHFKSMPQKDVVVWINKKNEIIKKIQNAINLKKSNKFLGKPWLKIVTSNIENSSKIIVDNINRYE